MAVGRQPTASEVTDEGNSRMGAPKISPPPRQNGRRIEMSAKRDRDYLVKLRASKAEQECLCSVPEHPVIAVQASHKKFPWKERFPLICQSCAGIFMNSGNGRDDPAQAKLRSNHGLDTLRKFHDFAHERNANLRFKAELEEAPPGCGCPTPEVFVPASRVVKNFPRAKQIELT